MRPAIALSFAGLFLWLVVVQTKLNSLEENYKFICALPIVTNKSVLLLQEREGKWVFDNDMSKSFYYVPGGCQ